MDYSNVLDLKRAIDNLGASVRDVGREIANQLEGIDASLALINNTLEDVIAKLTSDSDDVSES
jgi:hypothetical protein